MLKFAIDAITVKNIFVFDGILTANKGRLTMSYIVFTRPHKRVIDDAL